HKKTNINNYKDKKLNDAENNTIIFEFKKNKNYKKICINTMHEDIKKNKWLVLSDSLETNQFYFLSDSLGSNGRVFVLGDNEKTISWY
ncbi:MAG: hypothetical protein ACK5HT_06920, partial [Draconibacterium sp.]